MATTTPRIGLTKPDGTDLVDIAVLNTNFDKIDSNIASTKTQPTKPTTANAGDLWWDSDTGTLYVYYVGASSSSWVAATSDPINIGVVANQTERDAQYPTPAQGMRVFRTDLGVTQTYYGLYNQTTNPGGRDTAGWYDTEKSQGLVPVKPTTVTAVSGTATINSLGVVSFSGCTQIALDGVFTAEYKNYRLIYNGSNVQDATFRYRANGNPVVELGYRRTTSGYSYNATTNGATTDDKFPLTFTVSYHYASFVLDVLNPKAPGYPIISGNMDGAAGDLTYSQHIVAGCYKHGTTTEVDGFAVYTSGAANGTVQVFGYND